MLSLHTKLAMAKPCNKRAERGMTNDEDKKGELNLAYTYEDFSAHYLSDLFSAGHLRASRRQLHDKSLPAKVSHHV